MDSNALRELAAKHIDEPEDDLEAQHSDSELSPTLGKERNSGEIKHMDLTSGRISITRKSSQGNEGFSFDEQLGASSRNKESKFEKVTKLNISALMDKRSNSPLESHNFDRSQKFET